LKCRACGYENNEGSEFCQNCGKKLKKKTGIPILGFRSGNPLKMILATLFYLFLLIIIAVPVILFLVNDNITTSVNSAYYVDQIGNTSSANGQFMIMNVTVKNNGNGEASISPGSFSLDGSGYYYADTSSWQYNNTKIAPGANSTMLLVFDIETPDPDMLKFNSLWDPMGNVSASIGDIKTIPFDGQYASYTANITYKVGSVEKTAHATFTYKFTDVNSTHIKETFSSNITRFDISSGWYMDWSSKSEVLDNYYLTNEDGEYSSISILDSYYLSGVGDSVDTVDSSGNTVGEAVIDGTQYLTINGKSFSCWVVKTTADDYTQVEYYDMTTGLLLKRTENGSGTISYTGEMILKDTNVPLISVISN
jgi:hypothetical protein